MRPFRPFRTGRFTLFMIAMGVTQYLILKGMERLHLPHWLAILLGFLLALTLTLSLNRLLSAWLYKDPPPPPT
jgi:hypothetical protein